MLKVTEKGIVVGRRISLSEEDAQVILDMFAEYQDRNYLEKENGVWKYHNPMHER